jgi:sulfide dehydrogenase [flavocytochrome c] flavoprotein subunit
MIATPDRRAVLASAAALAAMGALPRRLTAAARGSVVIVGGGAGGAVVAHDLKMGAASLDVTLIEPKTVYETCFYSNLALGGFRSFASLEYGYDGLKALGIRVVHERAQAIDAAQRTVTLEGGAVLPFDKLVVAPGISLRCDAIEGYSEDAAVIMPHGWLGDGGARNLRARIEAMEDGGLVVMAAPPNPYRCPPGPYERASMIAHLLKTKKPKSKLLILDAKDAFSKQPAFEDGWRRHYPGLIEWQPASLTGGGVTRVDAKTMEIETGDGQTLRCAVANIIPPQSAGEIALRAGLADEGWCAVEARDFSSVKAPGAFVIGDAARADQMPKSAYAASSQAHLVAEAILADLAGEPRPDPALTNICWSMIAAGDSIKIGANYAPDGRKLVAEAPFVSQPGEAQAVRSENLDESAAWYEGMIEAMFAGR